MGLCYGANWYQHSGYSDLPHGHDLPQDDDLSTGSASGNLVPNISLSPVLDSQPDLDYPPLPPSKDGLASNQGERHYEMDVGAEQKFIETFPDCSNSYTGRFTFMDLFWQDEHAEEQHENLYFPFASGEEWEFSSWCLCSGLSMVALDSLLLLTIVST